MTTKQIIGIIGFFATLLFFLPNLVDRPDLKAFEVIGGGLIMICVLIVFLILYMWDMPEDELNNL